MVKIKRGGNNVNIHEFENLRGEFLAKEADLLQFKGGEYGDKIDRLLNFKEIAEFVEETPVEVCLLYLMKHIQSIVLSVKTGNYDKKWFWSDNDNEGLKQRISDARNYLILLGACIEEEVKEKHNG